MIMISVFFSPFFFPDRHTLLELIICQRILNERYLLFVRNLLQILSQLSLTPQTVMSHHLSHCVRLKTLLYLQPWLLYHRCRHLFVMLCLPLLAPIFPEHTFENALPPYYGSQPIIILQTICVSFHIFYGVSLGPCTICHHTFTRQRVIISCCLSGQDHDKM